MKKFVTIFLLLFFCSVFGYGVYLLIKEGSVLSQKASLLKIELEELEKENADLEKTINKLEIPDNLVKELKSQFNYRKPDEKLIIVVPKKKQN